MTLDAAAGETEARPATTQADRGSDDRVASSDRRTTLAPETETPTAADEGPDEASDVAEGAGPAAPTVRAAPPARVEPADTWAQAGRKVMATQLDRLLVLEPALHDPAAVDELRRYRVATRRLRAALRLFSSAYPGREPARLRRDLGGLARRVGAVRDLDVRLADLEAWAEHHAGGVERVEPLVAAWRSNRIDADRQLIRDLDSRHHARLLERLAAFTAVAAAPAPGHALRVPEPQELVADRAGSSVWRAYERVRSFGADLGDSNAEQLHGLRIEGKRLRYALEFMRDVLDDRSGLLVARLVGLQDRLGALNDAATTARAVAAFLGEAPDRLGDRERRALVAYQGAALARMARLRRSVPVAWRPVVSRAFGHRLSRVIAAIPPAAGDRSSPG